MPERDGGRRRFAFGLRLKITVAFLLVGLLMSGMLSYTVYRILDASLLRQVQNRVLDLAQLACDLVDVGALSRLETALSPDLSPAQVDAIEGSTDYRTVSDALNRVRSIVGKLVHYIYVFVPTRDPSAALYVVDADVLDARRSIAAGNPAGADVSHFSSPFDLTGFPVARAALAQRRPLVEDVWTYDSDFHVNSISGYAPVTSPRGAPLGVIGIDMVDTDVRLILSNATTVSLIAIAVAGALTVFAALLLGTLISRGIISLEKVVRLFKGEKLDARATVRTRDEVGRLANSFNEMADTIQQHSAQLEAHLTAYARFVPHDLLRLLDKKSILDVKLGDQTQKEMTVLFSDIVSFTSLSESMTPFENFNFINSYLRRMGPAIRDSAGFIDKFIGDAIMALFPKRPDDALEAAVQMQERLRLYNVHRRKSGFRPIAVGVGVHTGSLMLGTIGEDQRMDGSVISDTVNLCSRLQGLTRMYGSAILTTGQTLKLLEDPGRFHSRFIDRVRVRGRKETILIFEILDGEPPDQRERKLSYRQHLARALRLYYGRDFKGAFDLLKPLAQGNPSDEILRIYRKRSELLVNLGTPEGWRGYEEIDAHY